MQQISQNYYRYIFKNYKPQQKSSMRNRPIMWLHLNAFPSDFSPSSKAFLSSIVICIRLCKWTQIKIVSENTNKSCIVVHMDQNEFQNVNRYA